jgi:hypothetical protein
MLDGFTESWFISKVETVIQNEINTLPTLITARSDGVAHAVVGTANTGSVSCDCWHCQH